MPGFVNKWLLLPPGSFSSDTARIQPSERTKTNIKEDTFMLRYVLRASLAIVLMFAVGTLTAVAQYPGGGGGGMGGGSSPTYTPHGSYSNKGAIIGGIAGGTAVVGGILYWRHHHNQNKLQGCVNGNGDKVVNDKDKQTYSLTNTQDQTLKPGQRVELVGKKTKDDSGEPTFEVHKMSKDLGMCTPTTAENR